MDFRDLTYVLAIAKYQNITRAADSLFVGQPTLSKFLSGLEEELGLRLFNRLGRKYVPTYAGLRYIEKAEQILLLKEDLDTEMQDILRRDEGVLNVAFASMRCTVLLPHVLPKFEQLHPNVKVNVLEGNSTENDQRLLSGEIDVAFYTQSHVHEQIDYHPLSEEELLVCTCQGHPLGAKAQHLPGLTYPCLELAHLAGERVLLMHPSQRTRQIVDHILHDTGILLPNTLCTSNMSAIIGLVSAGYGVSLLLDSHLRHSQEFPSIDCYSLNLPQSHCRFVAATRKGSYISSPARDFIELVRHCI
ncbi:MAG: LysR family transcriptional regulator [Clostridia bacterium]|nr:LysR family transcriptional regulator [Clostridia bacterium]